MLDDEQLIAVRWSQTIEMPSPDACRRSDRDGWYLPECGWEHARIVTSGGQEVTDPDVVDGFPCWVVAWSLEAEQQPKTKAIVLVESVDMDVIAIVKAISVYRQDGAAVEIRGRDLASCEAVLRRLRPEHDREGMGNINACDHLECELFDGLGNNLKPGRPHIWQFHPNNWKHQAPLRPYGSSESLLFVAPGNEPPWLDRDARVAAARILNLGGAVTVLAQSETVLDATKLILLEDHIGERGLWH